MAILTRWVFGIFGGGALVALIFLFSQSAMARYGVNIFSGLFFSHTASPSVSIVTPNASSAVSMMTPTAELDTTFFLEEGVVFSEFVAPSDLFERHPEEGVGIVAISSSSDMVVASSSDVEKILDIFTRDGEALNTSVFGSPPSGDFIQISCAPSSGVPSYKIRINEVAWMGTVNSYSDEWIELYNTSSSSLSLVGFQLVASSSKSRFSVYFEEGEIISPHGYFLLERTDDDSAPRVFADKLYKGALHDEAGVVELFDASCVLLDRINFQTDFVLPSKNIERRSMELRSENTYGLYNGDIDPVSRIFGTPRRENSTPTLVVESIASTTEGVLGFSVATSSELVALLGSVSSTIGISTSSDEIVLNNPLTTPSTQEVTLGSFESNSGVAVFIREVLFDAEGSDVGKEFIELYNSSTVEVDLFGWGMKYTKGASTTVLAVFGESSLDTTTLGAQEHLLVGLNNYNPTHFGGIFADVRRSKSLPNGDDGDVVLVLYNSSGAEVDRITYSAQLIEKEGQSLERNEIGDVAAKDIPSPRS